MILYTLESDKKEDEEKIRSFDLDVKRFFIWCFLSAFCLVFYVVYNQFSHGVHSAYMTYLFAWPLVLGVLPSFVTVILMKVSRRYGFVIFELAASELYCFGVAALTVGSLLRGIFEIAGTSSVYQQWLMIAGWCMLAAGTISDIVKWCFKRKNQCES